MGALEMLECPDIAIVQHTSGVLKVAHNLFETGSKLSGSEISPIIQQLTTAVSFLTDLVYTAISFNVGSGDSPCVSIQVFLPGYLLTTSSSSDTTPSCVGKQSRA
jgi:hypothetical protein